MKTCTKFKITKQINQSFEKKKENQVKANKIFLRIRILTLDEKKKKKKRYKTNWLNLIFAWQVGPDNHTELKISPGWFISMKVERSS